MDRRYRRLLVRKSVALLVQLLQDPAVTITTESVLNEVNARHQTSWQLHDRLSGGYQSGAYLITDSGARRAVLKWSKSRDWAPTVLAAAPVVASARAAGWPTPCWLSVGQTAEGYPYQVQDFMVGTTQEAVTHVLLDLALPVIAQQAGLGRDGMRDWSRYDHDVVFGDHNDNRAAVAQSSPEGARLVDILTRLTQDHEDVVVPSSDLVHGDFNPENILVADGQLTAVIDVEAIGRGSRLHDLATLLLYAWLWGDQDVTDRLTLECRTVAAPGWMEVTLSAVTVDLLAFGVRHWPPHDLAAACGAAGALLLAQV